MNKYTPMFLCKSTIVTALILSIAIDCQAGLFDILNNAINTTKSTANPNSKTQEPATTQSQTDYSPKRCFEMIGNPQIGLPDQHHAFYILTTGSDYEPSDSRADFSKYSETSYYLAECYVSGKTGAGGPDYARNQKGFPPNRPEAYELAIPLYENAARHDHIPSLVRLSAIYADEKYSGKDSNISLTNLFRAARLGDRNSFDSLSQLYSSGFPGVTDGRLKFRGMELLADNGNPEAQIELSKWLVSKDSKKAFDEAKEFLVPLAAKGNASAIALLGEIEIKVNAARAEAQKAAADESARKEIADKRQAEAQQLAAAQKAAADEALQKQQAETQRVAAAQKAAEEQRTNIIVITCIIAFGTMLIVAIVGTYLGIKDRVVVFWGKRDVIVSFTICIILLICLGIIIALQWEHDNDKLIPCLKLIGVLSAVGFPLLIYSIRRSYIANNRSSKKTLLVLLTKLLVAGFTVIFSILTYIFAKSAVESAAKAHNLVGYTEEQRKEKLQHQKNAVSSAATAAFTAYIVYHLQELIKKLIKKNPLQTSKTEPTE